jgi:hypothetical protein
MDRRIATAAAALALALALAACGSEGSHSSSSNSRGKPASTLTAKPEPANFVRRVDNPWYPLRPGTSYRYRGEKDGKRAVDVYTVTNRTKTILGVPNTVVRDRLYLNGKLEETTLDWYAQDRTGNVWYFGEDTKELDANGKVKSTEGTWKAGVDGAEAGIFMPADPKVGQKFRQEYYKGQAEDHFEVLSLDAAVKVPYVASGRALKTKEWTPLEPGVIDSKYYVRGIGNVLEATVKGGNERLELVSINGRPRA